MKYQKNPNTKYTCSNPRKWILNETGIIRNIETILKTGDINKMTKDCYNLLMNMSGFIAHYDQSGFMSYYSDVEDLRADIMRSTDVRDYTRYTNDNYFSGGEQSEYYAAKSRIYSKLPALCDKYAKNTQAKREDKNSDRLALLEAIVEKCKAEPESREALLSKLFY